MAAKRRRGPGWIPDHHGAWAMVIVPPVVGVALSGPAWTQLPLIALWWVGYFFFFAAGLWLRSRRKARYWPPVRAYGIAVLILTAILALVEFRLAIWALPYTPLIAATAYLSHRRRDRSMTNDTVTVLAAGMMTAVVFHAGVLAQPGADIAALWPWTWTVTALVTAYFLGTVFYVKTNIRERNSRGWLIASILYHLIFTALTFGLALGGASIAGHRILIVHALVWAALTVRAAAVPMMRARPGTALHAMTAKRLAMVIGLGEIVFSILVPLTLLAG